MSLCLKWIYHKLKNKCWKKKQQAVFNSAFKLYLIRYLKVSRQECKEFERLRFIQRQAVRSLKRERPYLSKIINTTPSLGLGSAKGEVSRVKELVWKAPETDNTCNHAEYIHIHLIRNWSSPRVACSDLLKLCPGTTSVFTDTEIFELDVSFSPRLKKKKRVFCVSFREVCFHIPTHVFTQWEAGVKKLLLHFCLATQVCPHWFRLISASSSSSEWNKRTRAF